MSESQMVQEKAFAKINLGLSIVSKRPDGYHNIDTVMQSISLHDNITLKKAPGISVASSDTSIPTGVENTAFKAAKAFFAHAGIDYEKDGVQIHLEKAIPSGAGLGGGSSDAAAVLRGLNRLYSTNYGTDILLKLALAVGSDVPFCVMGGTQRAGGRGEILSEISSFSGFNTVLAMPDETVNTAMAYSLYSGQGNINPDMDALCIAVAERDLTALGAKIGNAFEALVFPAKPAIEKAKRDILVTGAAAVSMTGSGASVYGIYPSYDSAKAAYDKLRAHYAVFLVETTEGF